MCLPIYLREPIPVIYSDALHLAPLPQLWDKCFFKMTLQKIQTDLRSVWLSWCTSCGFPQEHPIWHCSLVEELSLSQCASHNENEFLMLKASMCARLPCLLSSGQQDAHQSNKRWFIYCLDSLVVNLDILRIGRQREYSIKPSSVMES